MHLANVRFLTENRSIDWFEFYHNLEERLRHLPAENCIPVTRAESVERAIARSEHALRHLR